jgi:hypothetical protein
MSLFRETFSRSSKIGDQITPVQTPRIELLFLQISLFYGRIDHNFFFDFLQRQSKRTIALVPRHLMERP